MKILHVPLSYGGLWPPAKYHMDNLMQLEHSMGYSSLFLGSADSDVLQRINNFDFDLVHIHGWPLLRESESFLATLKYLLLQDVKMIISSPTYQPFCQNSIMESPHGELCNPRKCRNPECSKALDIFSFIKDMPIFVYSSKAVEIYSELGFNKVRKMPICYYASAKYTPPLFDASRQKMVAILKPIDFFAKDIQRLDMIARSLDGLVLSYPKVFNEYLNANYGVISYQWPCSFPFEIGLCLKSGVVPIVDSKYQMDDFNGVSPIHFVKHDIDVNAVQNIASEDQAPVFKEGIAYDFWNKYGADMCIAWFSTAYEAIMNED